MNVVAMMLDEVAVWSAPGSSETQPSDENILRTQVWGLLSARSNLVFIFPSFIVYIVQCAQCALHMCVFRFFVSCLFECVGGSGF